MRLDADELRQIQEALEYARLDNLRTDICAFAEYVMVDEKGQPWTLAPHHREWYQLLWDQVKDIVQPGMHTRPEGSKDNLLVMAPREHGKTSTMVCFLLFCLGLNPSLRIKYVSGSEDLAIMVAGQVKKNIERNAKLHEVFPNLRRDTSGSWSGSTIDVIKVDTEGEWQKDDLGIKDSNLQAYGITSVATGGRADIIIFDDIIGSREAIQEPARMEKVARVFYTDWLNIGGKRHIVIGTPWTPDDIHAQLSQNSDWYCWKKPAIINDKPLWPEQWPIPKLMARKRLIGEIAFDLQFMLTGIREKIEWWTKAIVDGCRDRSLYYGLVPEGFVIKGTVLGIDPSASLKSTGSWCGLFALAYDEFKRKVVLEVRRLRSGPRSIAENAVEMMLTHRFESVYVENNAVQSSFLDLIDLVCESMNLTLKVPMHGYFTGSQKWNPELGLPRMVGDMQNGKWIIPWGDEHHQDPVDPLHDCVLCQWINEMLGYPYDTETTDLIMSSWLASTAIDSPKKFGDITPTVESNWGNISQITW